MDFSLFADNSTLLVLLASGLVAIVCGVISPFVVNRNMSFAVHGTAELAFTGAAVGLIVIDNAMIGAFAGAIVVATVFSLLGKKRHERDSSIGVVLAFGVALGIYLLSFYPDFAVAAENILFGNILKVSVNQILILLVVCVAVLATMVIISRPLMFASVDERIAKARGVKVQLLGTIFLYALALAVTAAAQVVGTLLVIGLAIAPGAAASRLTARPIYITFLAIIFALIASLGGATISLTTGSIKVSICVTFISFVIYLLARLLGTVMLPVRGS